MTKQSFAVFLMLTASVIMAGCTWFGHWFDRHSSLVDAARIPMQDAVRTAAASIPGGKAIEAELTTEGDRIVYEVDVLDPSRTSRTVYVDAKSGTIVKAER